MNWFCPNKPGYDSNYFLKVIMGEKRYLPINFNVGYKLKYFKKGITLDKKYIINKRCLENLLMSYINQTR